MVMHTSFYLSFTKSRKRFAFVMFFAFAILGISGFMAVPDFSGFAIFILLQALLYGWASWIMFRENYVEVDQTGLHTTLGSGMPFLFSKKYAWKEMEKVQLDVCGDLAFTYRGKNRVVDLSGYTREEKDQLMQAISTYHLG